MKLPKLIVFDLDFTLWDCGGTWCDCLRPPFRARQGRIEDDRGYLISLYRDVPDILDHCDQLGVAMALASRTEQPRWAEELVGLLEIEHRFRFSEIYPSSKLKHFRSLCAAANTAPEEMLFFDDEMRNILECSEIGVTCIHVDQGMSSSLLQRGLQEFNQRR